MQSPDKCTFRLHTDHLITHIFIESEPSVFQHNNFFKTFRFVASTWSPDGSKPRPSVFASDFLNYPQVRRPPPPPPLLQSPPPAEGGWGCGVLQVGFGESVWRLSPFVSSGGPSVPQDDFDKARHVSFFGVVGGEERMLLRRRRIN